MEALLAFFMESTFIGLWIFGWNKLSPRLHLATIWLAAIGTSLSAYFILAANSWMQHPVGYRVEPGHPQGRADQHLGAADQLQPRWPPGRTCSSPRFLVTGAVLIAVGAWHLARGRTDSAADRVFRRALRIGLGITLAAADRDRGDRRHPGPADGLPAADEDGRRRGALQHQSAWAPSRCSRSAR